MDVQTVKYVKWASGEKFYKVKVSVGAYFGRMLRKRFKRASGARAWGERAAGRYQRLKDLALAMELATYKLTDVTVDDSVDEFIERAAKQVEKVAPVELRCQFCGTPYSGLEPCCGAAEAYWEARYEEEEEKEGRDA